MKNEIECYETFSTNKKVKNLNQITKYDLLDMFNKEQLIDMANSLNLKVNSKILKFTICHLIVLEINKRNDVFTYIEINIP